MVRKGAEKECSLRKGWKGRQRLDPGRALYAMLRYFDFVFAKPKLPKHCTKFNLYIESITSTHSMNNSALGGKKVQ